MRWRHGVRAHTRYRDDRKLLILSLPVPTIHTARKTPRERGTEKAKTPAAGSLQPRQRHGGNDRKVRLRLVRRKTKKQYPKTARRARPSWLVFFFKTKLGRDASGRICDHWKRKKTHKTVARLRGLVLRRHRRKQCGSPGSFLAIGLSK